MNLGSFQHKDHSCIIFRSRGMIKFRSLYWDTGKSKFQDITTSKYYFVDLAMVQKIKQSVQTSISILVFAILSDGCYKVCAKRLSEAIIRNLTSFDLVAQSFTIRKMKVAEIRLIYFC